MLAASATNPPTRHLHVAFVAPSRKQVDEFWHGGVDAGYEDDGSPGERPQYTPNYYGAFLRDPDGNSAEAVRHDFVRSGGHIDHLWIRVRDLDAASGFYAATMRHTGLREGRRWAQGRQFRGTSATFSTLSPMARLPPSISASHSRRPIARPSTVSTGTQLRSAMKTPERLASKSDMGRGATQRRFSTPVGRGSSLYFDTPAEPYGCPTIQILSPRSRPTRNRIAASRAKRQCRLTECKTGGLSFGFKRGRLRSPATCAASVFVVDGRTRALPPPRTARYRAGWVGTSHYPAGSNEWIARYEAGGSAGAR